MKQFIPKKIFIEPEGDSTQYAQNILNKFKNIEKIYIDNFQEDQISLFNSDRDPITIGKEILLFKKFKGSFMKKCPGTKGLLCCNYYVINAHTNCHFDCTYCSLQNYLNKQAMVIYSNIDQMLLEVEGKLLTYPDRYFRIGTGELADSLAIDSITELSKILVPFFAKQKNGLLELKTKSDNISNLENLEHNGNTVIAFSLNPDKIVENDELFTATVDERLKAAQKVSEWGYKLAFHFDPVVIHKGYKEQYKNLIEKLFKSVDKNLIKWISMGGFRYSKGIKDAIIERFPKRELLLEEFILSDDNKMRYIYNERREMYNFIRGEILKFHPKAPLYMCMESKKMWKEIFGYLPHLEKNAKTLFDFR